MVSHDWCPQVCVHACVWAPLFHFGVLNPAGISYLPDSGSLQQQHFCLESEANVCARKHIRARTQMKLTYNHLFVQSEGLISCCPLKIIAQWINVPWMWLAWPHMLYAFPYTYIYIKIYILHMSFFVRFLCGVPCHLQVLHRFYFALFVAWNCCLIDIKDM